MNCKQCHKRSTTVFCSPKCKQESSNERARLHYVSKGKEHFKRKTQKISGPSLQSIWPKGELAYKINN